MRVPTSVSFSAYSVELRERESEGGVRFKSVESIWVLVVTRSAAFCMAFSYLCFLFDFLWSSFFRCFP